MDRTEALFRGIAKDVVGNEVITYQGEEFDFGKPFARMTVKEAILHFNPEIKAEQLEDLASATAIAESLKIDVKPTYAFHR